MIHNTYKEQIVGCEGEISYLTPEGHWSSTVLELSQKQSKQNAPGLRLTIGCEVPDSNGVRFRAGRNFQPNLVAGSNLHWFLKIWLGEERLRQFIDSGANWTSLVGERGIAEIRHIQGDQAKPFVNIESMRPLEAAQDSVTVNVPRLVKATTTTISTATVSSRVPAAVSGPGTMTATASTCPYCGTELNRFGPVR